MFVIMFTLGLLLAFGLCWALWSIGISNPAEQLVEMNYTINGGATPPLDNLILHCGNLNIAVSNTTTIAQLGECTFPGYMPVVGQTLGPAYLGADGNTHLSCPEQLFQATNGAFQTISNVAAGTITMAGSLAVVVTAAGMTGSPVTLAVPVLATDTPTDIAEKIAIVAQANADIPTFFNISTSGPNVILTALAAAANDATMNMSFATGSATGLTAKPTATQLRAGAVPGGTINDTIYTWYYTDVTNTILVRAANNDVNVPIATVGAAALIRPDVIWGA